jgi:hypothetical protein
MTMKRNLLKILGSVFLIQVTLTAGSIFLESIPQLYGTTGTVMAISFIGISLFFLWRAMKRWNIKYPTITLIISAMVGTALFLFMIFSTMNLGKAGSLGLESGANDVLGIGMILGSFFVFPTVIPITAYFLRDKAVLIK